MSQVSKPPIGVTITALVAVFAGVVGILVWISETLGDPSRGDPLAAHDFGTSFRGILGLILLAASSAELAFGIGALRRARWAWAPGIFAQAAIVAASLVRIDPFYGYQPYDPYFRVGLVLVAAVSLVYLLRPSVRRAFEGLPSPSLQTASHRRPPSSGPGAAAAVAMILGTLGFFGGLVSIWLVQLMWGMDPGRTTASPDYTVPVVLIVVSSAEVVFGIGALRKARWAWPLGVLAQLTLALALLFVPVLGLLSYLIALVPGAMLLYLISPSGRRSFNLDGQALANG
jgi:hypothetical protein